MSDQNKKFLRVLTGKSETIPPVWLMRQAGRYLPEYRELRARAGGFLNMVYNPDHACEITMQPLRRFGFDAAILFSDILVVPHALGQSLTFEAGEGPRLDPLRTRDDLDRLAFDPGVLAPIYETIRLLRAQMAREGFFDTALIGFAGAPWTVATYMVEGGGSKDMIHVKSWAYGDPAGFALLIDKIVQVTAEYLCSQIGAGAEAVQIFDSWAGALDEQGYERWVIEPAKAILAILRRKYPAVPVIGFPRGSGSLYRSYAAKAGVSALGLDQHLPASDAAVLQKTMPVQGNLDPARLLAGGRALDEGVDAVMRTLGGGPLVFNLGHGVIKETPPAHVEQLLLRVRNFSA